ncbi:MAG: hypothetical protein KC547_12560 [Anaerolineae bacterium]|nr:hypothetical protein [Anaerolineae bacterium]
MAVRIPFSQKLRTSACLDRNAMSHIVSKLTPNQCAGILAQLNTLPSINTHVVAKGGGLYDFSVSQWRYLYPVATVRGNISIVDGKTVVYLKGRLSTYVLVLYVAIIAAMIFVFYDKIWGLIFGTGWMVLVWIVWNRLFTRPLMKLVVMAIE